MKRNGQVYFALIGSILSALFLSFGADLFAQDDSDTQARSLKAVASSLRRALIIGIDDYPPWGATNDSPDLRSSAKDARDLAKALEEYAGYSPENIVLMTFENGDDPNNPLAPTAENIRRELSKMASELRSSHSFLFSFSGHGVELGEKSNDDTNLKSYLCPCDVDLSRLSSFIDREWVMQEMERCPAERKIIITDACRNLIELAEGARSKGGLALAKGLSDPFVPGEFGFVQIASCRTKQCSIESEGNGLFTKALIDGLCVAADDSGELSLQGWFDFAQERTMEWSAELLKSTPRLGYFDSESGRTQKVQEPTMRVNGELPRWIFADNLPVEGLRLETWTSADTIYHDACNLRKRRNLSEAKAKIDEALQKTEQAIPGSHKRERYIIEKERIDELISVTPLDLSSSGRQAGERRVITVKGIEYAFRWCPAGSFLMGSPEDEEKRDDDETQHEVTLTHGFWMLETEVTQEMWESVMGDNPSWFSQTGGGKDDVSGNTNKYPVEEVNWAECQAFCRQLSNLASTGTFSLPTEAQWEYACRAGTRTPFSFGAKLNGDKANCNGNYPYGTKTKGAYLAKTTAVKSYAPNAWGLYDMHGNVYEWCSDWYNADYYTDSPSADPTGPNSGSGRVSRGGCWGYDAVFCRCARRIRLDPAARDRIVGLRVLLVR